MDALFLRLSELPFYLDIVAFWAMVFGFGFRHGLWYQMAGRGARGAPIG